MKVLDTLIPEVKILEPNVFGDERGYFMETFRDDWFRENVADEIFVQDNHSKSSQGILRGLHYQTQQAQGKLVRVVQGEVYDVAVDVRDGSPTYGHHVGILLNAENKRQLWVPKGFAHGFYVTTKTAEFVYKCTDYYAPQYEQSILWSDPKLNIQWPLFNGQKPLVSAKDEAGFLFAEAPKF
jgi:dTDP-4-dehydrorhamnose 3,5-epimerase